MARRRVGRKRPSVGAGAPPRDTTLGEISALTDWTEIDRHLLHKPGEPRPPDRMADVVIRMASLCRRLLLEAGYRSAPMDRNDAPAELGLPRAVPAHVGEAARATVELKGAFGRAF